jgi:hypothetical protein
VRIVEKRDEGRSRGGREEGEEEEEEEEEFKLNQWLGKVLPRETLEVRVWR